MVYIKGLKFRGFKSFRRAEASFSKGYVCLAGPNGSGKSNVTDGIRFALGEASLKALRARRVSELINTSCKSAEVTLFIEGEHPYEIRRTVNADGTTEYRLNGKRTTRTLVLEELRQHGIEVGSHNILAQGQVQKIIEMSAKERRQIIDAVSGIAEFDAKKEEAIRELEKVDAKISEANIVLGERGSQLAELERQKDDALSYLSAQESFRRATASMASAEYAKLSKAQSDVVKKQAEANAAKNEVARQSCVLNARHAELEGQRQQLVAKLGSSSTREAALAEIEALKVRISADLATLVEKRKEAVKIEAQQKQSAAQSDSIRRKMVAAQDAAKALSDEEKSLSRKLAELEKASGGANQEASQAGLDLLSDKILSIKERRAAAEAGMRGAQKLLAIREEEKSRLSATLSAPGEERLPGELSVLRKEVAAHEARIEGLFSRERDINRTLPDLDRRLLSLKEKAATLRASLSPAATSLALRAVEEMKESGMKGIFGTVASLVTCEPKYGVAVEAAAGQRLNYIVVDRTDTAVRAIERLKEQKSGRCTFIPLDMPRSKEAGKSEKQPGCLGALVGFVDFDPAFDAAMAYVFSDTLLFESVQSAKKAGIGAARMVTLEGELIEKSGIITGGSLKGSLLSRSSLEKAEADTRKADSDRATLYSQLYQIRDEMASARKEKAAAEVKLRGIEVEMAAAEGRAESGRKAREAVAEIEKHIAALSSEIEAHKKTAEGLSQELSSAILAYEVQKKRTAEDAEAARKADAESQRELRAIAESRSGIAARIQAKTDEVSRLSTELSEKAEFAKELSDAAAACKKETASLAKSSEASEKEKAEKEVKLAEISSSSQKLFAKMKELDSQIADIAQQLGKLRAEEERRANEGMELEIRRQTTETRLADIKVTLDQYAGVATIDASRQELEELSAKSRAAMDAFGATVNLQAPQLYDEKKRDIDEIKTRVASLDSEKKAVFAMMDELEGKKRAIFISTFTAVNDNFKRIFGYVFQGEGTLLLEQPSSPFESGLLVKVHDGKHDKYLDSMSGGEKSLLALLFIFAIQMHKAAPFYIFDEADTALDKENSRKLAELVKQLSGKTQFIVVTHNDTMLANADVALGVMRTDDGSKMVGVQLTSSAAVAHSRKA